MLTTQQAAKEIGRTHRVVKAICAEHSIGTLVTPRLRLLTATEVKRVSRIAESRHRGRPGLKTTKTLV